MEETIVVFEDHSIVVVSVSLTCMHEFFDYLNTKYSSEMSKRYPNDWRHVMETEKHETFISLSTTQIFDLRWQFNLQIEASSIALTITGLEESEAKSRHLKLLS